MLRRNFSGGQLMKGYLAALVLFLLALSGAQVAAQTRRALLIGINTYQPEGTNAQNSPAARRKKGATQTRPVAAQGPGKRALLPVDDTDDAKIEDPGSHARQHPRVFYRREPETEPFVVAKPAAVQPPPPPL
jgi:hypothetical protein